MRSMTNLIGLSLCALLTTTAATAATDSLVAKASKALAGACADECYLNLTGRDGAHRTVLIRNGEAANRQFAFEVIARDERTDWEGLRVNSDESAINVVSGWKDHARVDTGIASGTDAYRAELHKLVALVRRDQATANPKQTELQRDLLKYLIELGYAGQ